MSKITAELSTDPRLRLNMVMKTKERFLTAQSPQDPTTAVIKPLPWFPAVQPAAPPGFPGEVCPESIRTPNKKGRGRRQGCAAGLGSSLWPTLRSDHLPGITTRRKSKHRSQPCASEYPVMGPPNITSLSGRIILTKTRYQSRKRNT